MILDLNIGRGMTACGVYTVSQGTTWQDVTLTDYASLTGTAIDSGSRVVEVSLRNTHATETLYLLLSAGGSVATSSAIAVGAGETVDVDGLLQADDGGSITTLAVQGSAAATTGVLVVGFQAG